MIHGIFIESTVEQGLLYQRYANIPQIVDKFIEIVDKAVDHANKVGIEGYEKFDLSTKLEKFKSDVKIEMKDPMPINVQKLKSTKSSVNAVKNEAIQLLNKLGNMRKKSRFGDNYIKGVIIKPKIFHDTIDDNTHTKVNSFLRQINRSMDWIEKVILDLMNLADQDNNLLTLVSTVYHRKIFEDVDWNNMMTESFDLLCEEVDDYIPRSGVEDKAGFDHDFADDPIDDESEENVVDTNKDDSDLASNDIDEEYYPVFPISISYDYNYDDKSMVSTGHNLHKITNGDEYTHSIISFDPSLTQIYHFQTHGIEVTSIYDYKSVRATKSIYVSVVFVTKKERDQIMEVLEDCLHNIDDTHYDFLGFVNQILGKHARVNRAFICSTFVGYLLNVANKKNLPRDYSEYRPGDVTILPRAFFVMTFKNVDDFKERGYELQERVKKIYDENIDEIREYNNILPKVVLDNNIREAGSIRKFLWKVLDKFGV